MFFYHVVVVADECYIVLVGFLLLVCWLGWGCVGCRFGRVLGVAVWHEHCCNKGCTKVYILIEWVVILISCGLEVPWLVFLFLFLFNSSLSLYNSFAYPLLLSILYL